MVALPSTAAVAAVSLAAHTAISALVDPQALNVDQSITVFLPSNLVVA